jgi:DNA-binding transcriptional MerR regulator
MDHFTIKDIENLSGIKAHTWRIWEKRYGIINPKRKKSNHRFYDNEDLKHLLRIAHLYNNGHKISAIANMNADDVYADTTNEAFAELNSIRLLLEATIDLDELLFNETIEKSINKLGLEDCMVKVVYPYFERIGMLWMNNEALPAQERFASNIILKKIVREIDKLDLSFDDNKPTVLLFTPPGEYHEIPLLFMHYLLKKNQFHVYYLGTDISFDTIDALIKANKTDILYLHVITNLTHDDINNYIRQITERFVNQRIVMSGKPTQFVSVRAGNLRLLRSLTEMLSFGKGVQD